MILFTLIARIVVLFGLPLTLFSIPYFVFAAPLVPSCSGTECGFDDLIVLVRRIFIPNSGRRFGKNL